MSMRLRNKKIYEGGTGDDSSYMDTSTSDVGDTSIIGESEIEASHATTDLEVTESIQMEPEVVSQSNVIGEEILDVGAAETTSLEENDTGEGVKSPISESTDITDAAVEITESPESDEPTEINETEEIIQNVESTEITDAEEIIQTGNNNEVSQSDIIVEEVTDISGDAQSIQMDVEKVISESDIGIPDVTTSSVLEARQPELTLIDSTIVTVSSEKMSERGSSRRTKRKDTKDEIIAEAPPVTTTAFSPQVSSISSPTVASTPSDAQAPPRRSRAPSPTMVSRMQEKKELAGLNDRLASYIDRVRFLETENRSLTTRIEKYDETQQREVSNIKVLYEKELQDARKLLDQLAKDKTELKILSDRHIKDAEHWKDKYNKAARDLAIAEKNVVTLESKVNELQSRLNEAINQKKYLESEYNKTKVDLTMLEKKYATTLDQLESETKLRTDYQNKAKSLEEELNFKKLIHVQELNETRIRSEITIDEVEGSMIQDYDSKLRDALVDMRSEYENQIRSTREETEMNLLGKMDELKKMAMERNNTASTTWEELKTVRSEIDELRIAKKSLQSKLNQAQSQIDELSAQLHREKLAHEGDILNRDAEIKRLEMLVADQIEEYKDLMDIKVALDLEICNYRKLLEGEEARLNLSQNGENITPTRMPGSAGRKRKRMHLDEDMSFTATTSGGELQQSYISTQKKSCNFEISTTAIGALEVQETDEEGKYVKVYNSSNDKEMAIGGFSIIHKAGEDETVFKFHRTIHVAPNSTCTVWSSESEGTHSPPHDLLMTTQKWFLADEMQTQILDADGVEIACRTMKKKQLRSSYYTTSIGEPFQIKKYRESILYSEGDPKRAEGDKCAIM